ncbi:MAG: ChbG/HpnK family deacetylase [Chthoniobacterales bacterium]|nr:ChbG/HpnK family deacetylase [Chthoniobacterales bacterium]
MQDKKGDRFLIVNADDFGQTAGINRGIIEAHEGGIVTSASLMVRHPTAVEAAKYARAHHNMSVGLHFELMEWRYSEGEWRRAYEVVDSSDDRAIRAEFERQLARFEALLGRKPTHLDSHQHVHQREPVRLVLEEFAERLSVPLRGLTPGVAHCGKFFGQDEGGASYPDEISLPHLVGLIQTLPPGWTELGCHPGHAEGLDSVYRLEREAEVRVLCSREIRDVIARHKVSLCSFHDLRLQKN